MLAFTLAYHMGISKYFLLYPVILLVQDVFMLGFGFRIFCQKKKESEIKPGEELTDLL